MKPRTPIRIAIDLVGTREEQRIDRRRLTKEAVERGYIVGGYLERPDNGEIVFFRKENKDAEQGMAG